MDDVISFSLLSCWVLFLFLHTHTHTHNKCAIVYVTLRANRNDVAVTWRYDYSLVEALITQTMYLMNEYSIVVSRRLPFRFVSFRNLKISDETKCWNDVCAFPSRRGKERKKICVCVSSSNFVSFHFDSCLVCCCRFLVMTFVCVCVFLCLLSVFRSNSLKLSSSLLSPSDVNNLKFYEIE